MAVSAPESKRKLIATITEIFRVIIISKKYLSEKDLQSCSKISINIKEKQGTSQKGVTFFNVKVACNRNIPFLSLIQGYYLPHLCALVCSMQALEEESYLAIQCKDENEETYSDTVMWLDASKQSEISVKILSQKSSKRKANDDFLSAIQIRIYMIFTSISECALQICELMDNLKIMNPKAQLYFSMNFGGSLEIQLCNISSIKTGDYNICLGLDILNRKLTDRFNMGETVVHCSQRYILKSTSQKFTSPTTLSCIVCFIPLLAIEEQQFKSNYTPGTVKIQMYGPHGIPFSIKLHCESRLLNPETLIPWEQFGIQVKRKFKYSSYNLESGARLQLDDETPGWARCDRFILMFCFVVDYKPVQQHENVCSIKDEIELLELLEELCVCSDALKACKEVGLSCMNLLFNQHRLYPTDEQPIQKSTSQVDSCALYKRLVPEVVSSLVDIFTRSTNTKFRSEVAQLVPIDSRNSMTKYLEDKLMSLVTTTESTVHELTPLTLFHDARNYNIINEAEDDIDNWNFRNESACVEPFDMSIEVDDGIVHASSQSCLFTRQEFPLANTNEHMIESLQCASVSSLRDSTLDKKFTKMTAGCSKEVFVSTDKFNILSCEKETQDNPNPKGPMSLLCKKRSSEFTDTLYDGVTQDHDNTNSKNSVKKNKKNDDSHCFNESCYENILFEKNQEKLSQECYTDEESDWFDEDEVAKWFLEMDK